MKLDLEILADNWEREMEDRDMMQFLAEVEADEQCRTEYDEEEEARELANWIAEHYDPTEEIYDPFDDVEAVA